VASAFVGEDMNFRSLEMIRYSFSFIGYLSMIEAGE